MTVIGSNTDRLQTAAGTTGSDTGGARSVSVRMHGLLHSLTYSLELACRGYLCAPLVDCDPVTDPECSEAGKKLQFPTPTTEAVRTSAAEELREMPRPDA